LTDFPPTTSDRVRRYHWPRYAALAVDLAFGLAGPALLAWTPAAEALHRAVHGGGWVLESVVFALAVAASVAGPRFPVDLFRHRHERRFGFSQQPTRAWAVDWAKATLLGAGFTIAAVVPVVGLAHAFPHSWGLLAAPLAALAVLVVGFVTPVLLEPVFNRFRPLDDEAFVRRLRALADRAGVPVRDVLVADASRRTSKVNAYVSGLGRTRRVVLFDTLLAKLSPDETALVVAHELGHRRYRHVFKNTALAMASAAGFVLLAWILLGPEGRHPQRLPELVVLAEVLSLLAAPLLAALSRRWELLCDAFAVRLTGDLAAFEGAFAKLTEANLPDDDPPRVVYLWLFSHPTVRERVAAARAVG
jgi:STE24 endopeptidase